mmetsp:Transcript_3108/g.6150  ORF Transcript_3108/g.6150 Transcript_3108/m.6150 type:complete len:145 (+) Transcript_3108:96-530(+)|eukprot:CAMPEP_0173377894 /NCGR_PEP_ID=MMETSP1356-20130122/1171_1 /TAXON_ID=77927 ORGANISM="Hemiselmis virescens, Strain PCC157" /NCGR_SAMPLE_ID=MMETSP1356 /ASSEMBLY_ACC=CAM_ASM_000847 /LENGTH=144 /DNA_ID=CAMNT_0014330805 /DNA_START=66 /DNA_END=500 /DNA_ORIENTATION=-
MDDDQKTEGSFKAQSDVSESRKELSAEQRTLLFQSRIVMFLLIIIFVVCSLFEIARIIMCIILLALMGSMSCVWEEESYLASSDSGVARRVRNIICQVFMVIIPLGTAGWMSFICYAMFAREAPEVFSEDQLSLFETPRLMREF